MEVFNENTIEKLANGRQSDAQVPGAGTAVHQVAIEIIRRRAQTGIKKYGEPLKSFNGRDPAMDMVQESIDALLYGLQLFEEWTIQQEIIERLLNILECLTNRLYGLRDEAVASDIPDEQLIASILEVADLASRFERPRKWQRKEE